MNLDQTRDMCGDFKSLDEMYELFNPVELEQLAMRYDAGLADFRERHKDKEIGIALQEPLADLAFRKAKAIVAVIERKIKAGKE